MAEQLDLTAPVAATLANWKVWSFTATRWDKSVVVEAISNTGQRVIALYPTPSPGGQPSGQQLISGINKGNFSGANDSLDKALLKRLETDGYIGPGTVTGTPD